MTDPHDPDGVRLQKLLASVGLGSRRACEKLITSGRVKVDGTRVLQLGTRVDPDKVIIHVDDMQVLFDDSLITLALNKPLGVVSSMADEYGRPDLSQYVEDRDQRLYHVGRLDAETDGLLLLTNHGELSHRLAHPSYLVPKTYVALVDGVVRRGLWREIRDGIELDDGMVKVDHLQVLEQADSSAIVEVTLHEGRKHVVRRLLGHIGHPVQKLTRTHFGPIHLGRLKHGRTRVIGGQELGHLMKSVGL